MHDDLYESICRRIADLSEDSLMELSHYIAFLKWQEEQWREWGEEELALDDGAGPDEDEPLPRRRETRWVYDFLEHFEAATVTATKAADGMEVRVGPAMCELEQRLALWQHPPATGASVVQYQFAVPADVTKLRLRAKIGIRNGALIAESPGNFVAFRLMVNGVRLWSQTKNTSTWEDVAVDLPTLAGEPATVQFITDGLGDSRWNWAVWGTPLLVGE